MSGAARSFLLLLTVTSSVMIARGESERDLGWRPGGLAVSSNREFCLVGDAQRGSLIILDLANASSQVRRLPVPSPVRDLVRLDGDSFAAIAANRRELIRFACDGHELIEWVRIPLAVNARRLAVSSNRQWLCVSDLWACQVQLIAREAELMPSQPISLPFEPQEVLGLDSTRFLVTDAFAGGIAMVDAATHCVTAIRQIHGHAIRGLDRSLDGASVVVTHQRLSRVARTEFDDLHWGNTIQSLVSRFSVDALLDDQATQLEPIERIRLGDIGHGFADPTGIVDAGDWQVIASGGANQLAIVRGGRVVDRLNTGLRPTKVIRVSDRRLLVLNAHEASITEVKVDEFEPEADAPTVATRTIELGQPPAATPGEIAFYRGSLSHDAWLSCNSCHVDGHTAGVLADTFGDGGFGNPKRIPSLLGLASTGPYGWLGNKPNLKQQIESTLRSTMHGPDECRKVIPDLVRYLHSLELPDRAQEDPADELVAGKAFFKQLQCAGCHTPPTYTSRRTYDVGVLDELGHSRFNPPSLRGLPHRRRLFHDGRFDSLEQLLMHGKHQLPRKLDAREREQLLGFLRSL